MQEELQGVLQSYERRGYFDEVISLMEAGLSLERAHVSFYFASVLLEPSYMITDGSFHRIIHLVQQVSTWEALVFSNFFSLVLNDSFPVVMEHLKLFVSRINIPKVS